MSRSELMRQLTAQQFAAFDTQLYLDTHPNDQIALHMFLEFREAAAELQNRFEELYGPLTAERAAGDRWNWISDPWPWERSVE